MIIPGLPPSYSPYSAKLPVQQNPISNSRNALWKSWGLPAVGLGGLLLFIGIAMLPIEISRIFCGSLNKGEQNSFLLYPNYNADRNSLNAQFQIFEPDLLVANSPYRLDNKGVVPFSAVAAANVQASNYPIQDKYLWPWSHASLLFLLVTIAAGGIGILSGFRRTYSSGFAFFVLSFLSAMLAIFLIAYYSTEVYWQLNQNNDRRKKFMSHRLDYSFSAVMLALSCASCFFSFISTLYAGLSLGICCGSKAPLQTYSNVRTARKAEAQFVPIKAAPQYVPVSVVPRPVGSVIPRPVGSVIPRPVRPVVQLQYS